MKISSPISFPFLTLFALVFAFWGCDDNGSESTTLSSDSTEQANEGVTPPPNETSSSSSDSETNEESATKSPTDRNPDTKDTGGAFVEHRCAISEFEHITGAKGAYLLPEIFGSGTMLFDYDGDGDLDAYLVQSGHWENPAGEEPATNRLYRNDGQGKFTDVTEASGLGDAGYGMGCSAGDIDNDGDLDVWVNNFQRSSLYLNNGDGTFRDITLDAGLGKDLDIRWFATSSCFLDYDLDGDLDLYVAHYLGYTHETNKDCGTSVTGIRDYCSPGEFPGLLDALYRNDSDGDQIAFTDVTEEVGIVSGQEPDKLRNAAKGLGVVSADFDNNGWPDLYVANDQVGNLLYLNKGDGTFEEDAFARGCAYSRDGTPEASMGVTAGDPDNDGDFDLFMTHLDLETNTFYENDEGYFEDATARHNLELVSKSKVGFGTEFFDYDCDGDQDLVVTNGHVLLNVSESRGAFLTYDQPDQLFRNDGTGSFEDVSAQAGSYFSKRTVGRGLSFGDVDDDGDPDLLIGLHGDHEDRGLRGFGTLLLNQVGQNANRLILELRGDGSTTSKQAVGSRVTITVEGKTQIREVQAGSSYGSQSDSRLYFGLGESEKVDRLEIRWASRNQDVEVLENVEASAVVVIEKGKGLIDRRPF